MLTTILCFLSTWTLGTILFWSIWLTLKTGINYVRKLHQIPCHACEFFTNDYRLKCTVRPIEACSERAINCIDFAPKTSACNACQRGRRKLY
jgi:hypothetical protein